MDKQHSFPLTGLLFLFDYNKLILTGQSKKDLSINTQELKNGLYQNTIH
jgi:hypothetical protein